MATKSINTKSKRFDVRVPLAIAAEVERLKQSDESIGQFVVTALEGEIKRRLKTQRTSEQQD